MKRTVLTTVGVLVVYFALPVGELPHGWEAVVSVLGIVVGGAVLALLIVHQVRLHLRSAATGDDTTVRIQSLVLLIQLAVLIFALGYYQLADATDDQFVGIETKIDALYFTITTLSTVGFGDIHARGQMARALVTGQIAFSIVFLGTLVSILTTQVRERAAARTATSAPGTAAGAEAS